MILGGTRNFVATSRISPMPVSPINTRPGQRQTFTSQRQLTRLKCGQLSGPNASIAKASHVMPPVPVRSWNPPQVGNLPPISSSIEGEVHFADDSEVRGDDVSAIRHINLGGNASRDVLSGF
jgi:hypothetical protein